MKETAEGWISNRIQDGGLYMVRDVAVRDKPKRLMMYAL